MFYYIYTVDININSTNTRPPSFLSCEVKTKFNVAGVLAKDEISISNFLFYILLFYVATCFILPYIYTLYIYIATFIFIYYTFTELKITSDHHCVAIFP